MGLMDSPSQAFLNEAYFQYWEIEKEIQELKTQILIEINKGFKE